MADEIVPLFHKAYMSAGEIAEACENRRDSYTARQLYQFIADWNSRPQNRAAMLKGGPSSRNTVFQRAAIAAVLHALCDRDRFPLPTWASHEKHPTEITLDGIEISDRGFGNLVKQESPRVCSKHNVFFEASEMEKGTAFHARG